MRFLPLLLLVVIGCSSSSAPPLFNVGSGATVSGTVTNINVEPMAVDGDGVITLETADGATARIFIAARAGLCEATGLSLIGELAVGEIVEASGEAVGGTNVRPCVSADHFLRRVEG